jgi:hypothetical protein
VKAFLTFSCHAVPRWERELQVQNYGFDQAQCLALWSVGRSTKIFQDNRVEGDAEVFFVLLFYRSDYGPLTQRVSGL